MRSAYSSPSLIKAAFHFCLVLKQFLVSLHGWNINSIEAVGPCVSSITEYQHLTPYLMLNDYWSQNYLMYLVLLTTGSTGGFLNVSPPYTFLHRQNFTLPLLVPNTTLDGLRLSYVTSYPLKTQHCSRQWQTENQQNTVSLRTSCLYSDILSVGRPLTHIPASSNIWQPSDDFLLKRWMHLATHDLKMAKH